MNQKIIIKSLQILMMGLGSAGLLSCTSSGPDTPSGNLEAEATPLMSQFDMNAYPINKVVCDPFGDGSDPTPATLEHGIRSSLFYRTPDQPIYHNVLDMVTKTKMSEQTLFFPDMNVSTRLFQEGFATQTSSVVNDDSGAKLVEYFALKMNTEIALGPEDEEGQYQFAVLSDDGSRVSLEIDGQQVEIINNDGDHPTKMGCSTSVQTFTKSMRIPAEVLYYQGPRYHIANVLLWRKVGALDGTVAAQDLSESLCNKSGNSYFFNPNQNSAPQAPYLALLSRGWKPLKAENFIIPGSGLESSDTLHMAYNPCVQLGAPVISEFAVGEVLSTDAFVYWKTDVLATAQVLIIEAATGATVLTTSDNILRTDHEVQLTNLKPNTLYKVQAVSASEQMGRTISPPIDLKTAP